MNPTTRTVSAFAELGKKRPQGSLQADPETASSVVKNREEQIHSRTHRNNEEARIKKVQSFATIVTALLLSGLMAPMTHAQEASGRDVVGMAAPSDQSESQAEIEAYWTPQRLLSAKPVEPQVRLGENGFPIVNELETQQAPSRSVGGAAPSAPIADEASKILVPEGFRLEAPEAQVEAQPLATSSFGAYFTTTRVFPDAATTIYPYATTGKLFFQDPRTGDNFVCSGSVLRLRVVVTAGACVAHGSTTAADQYFYSKFLFVPSENNGAAPVGTWTWSYVSTTNAWYQSGSLPNQQDVGMLVLVDQKIGGKGPFKIGQVTGYLGYYYCTGTNCSSPPISKNNLTILGYPCNLDSCEKMEQTGAQTFESGGSNTWIYGSAMKVGAGGGPWIQDFGVNPVGAPAGLLGNNYVEAVTSYVPNNTSLMYLGASAFDARFYSLLTLTCSHAGTGGC
jgi:V8-like Glu-specific endopeptidase